jgi:hypothetical protein
MTVRLTSGIAYVPGPSAIAGTYSVPNDGNIDFTVPASNATLSRQDLIVCRVQDSFYSGATNDDDFIYLTGTAASTPSDPALPAGASYLTIARIFVANGATSIAQGNITYLAVIAPREGGIQRVSDANSTVGMAPGQYRDAPTLGLQRWDGAAWQVIPTGDTGYVFYTPAAPLVAGPNGSGFRRVGKTVEFTLDSSYNGVYSAGFSPGTLPVGYRPLGNRYLIGVNYGTAGGQLPAIQIAPNGLITFCHTNSPTWAGVLITGTYLIP